MQAQIEKHTIPKVIWMLWLQGLDNAPEVVHKCHTSWHIHNPEWKIVFLDETSLKDYLKIESIIDTDRKDISVEQVSNLIRINLLSKYGGVWVDATTFCCRPLDDWLDRSAPSGFFAFNRPGPGTDRILSNWFMASTPGNYLISTFAKEHNRLWKENIFSNQAGRWRKFIVRKLSKYLNKNEQSTRWWLSFVVLKIFRIYPYFIFHYHFAEVLRKDDQFRSIWSNTKKISAVIPHRLLRFGLLRPLTDEIKNEIDTQEAPLYKLTWKYDTDKFTTDSALGYLFNTLERDALN